MKKEVVKMDPRTKVLFFAALFTLAFVCRDLWVLLIMILVVITVALSSRERMAVLRGLKIMVPVLLVAFVLWTFLYRWSLFHSYGEGLSDFQVGLFMTIRLLLIIVTSLTFVSLVTPGEMIKALESFRLPYKLVFVLGLTLRHVSTMTDEYMAIKEAQTSRGLELDKGFLIKRIRNYIPVLVPLLIRSIENAEKLVLAMELKSLSFERRRYTKGRMSKTDYAIVISLSMAVSLSILHYIMRVI